MTYNHKEIDRKWQERWERDEVFKAEDFSQKETFYCLVEFPYPSGAGLHIGHPRSYTAIDVIARKKRMEGKNVLYPMGWDAFGLPTENYAIKTGRKPQEVTKENIDRFRAQLKSIGLSFDWSREVNTTDPEYYKWTQWMFLEFFKAGLAYKAKMPINWCTVCKIGLANEEVVAGVCERCGGKVEKRDKEQWMIAITKYADRLIDDLETVDYLPKIKKQQIDWIGRSEGAEIVFETERVLSGDHFVSAPSSASLPAGTALSGSPSPATRRDEIRVFTTRPDTLFGVTYIVLAPENPLVAEITTEDQKSTVEAYIAETQAMTDVERGAEGREKTGVFTGAYAVHPITGEKIPVWVADYVLMNYGTGAIMAVPAHDERDYAFAKAFNLPVKEVISGGDVEESAYSGDGVLVNSDFLDGLNVDEAKVKMNAWLEKEGKGKKTFSYRLRDWVFSRQRYWGEPIPLVKCEGACSPETEGWIAVPESELPVTLPEVEKYEPTDTGESPLSVIDEWVNTKCPECGGSAKRETDTMPNWAGSSWYFLRYIDPKNTSAFAEKEKLQYWMPVDLYNGGMEHTTLHLLYSRFWNKFLYDRGYAPTSEPYAKRTSHGMILASDGTKMSKSKGNVINPDEIVASHGADTLRVYEMFIGPFAEPVPWSENGVSGVRRFLDRVSNVSGLVKDAEPESVTRALHKTIKKVTEDIEEMHFNTAVAQMMSFVNEVYKEEAITKESFITFLSILSPFAPHVTNELAEALGQKECFEALDWPTYDESLVVDTEVTIAVQVNGKLRGQIQMAADADKDAVIAAASTEANVAKYLEGEVKRVIVVPNKLVNFVL